MSSDRLPRISGREAIAAFEKIGFTVRRTKGSHAIMKREGTVGTLSIPCHAGRTIGVGLLKSLVKTAGLTVGQFNDLL